MKLVPLVGALLLCTSNPGWGSPMDAPLSEGERHSFPNAHKQGGKCQLTGDKVLPVGEALKHWHCCESKTIASISDSVLA
eukprot:3507430-Rhodomonas_salina.6